MSRPESKHRRALRALGTAAWMVISFMTGAALGLILGLAFGQGFQALLWALVGGVALAVIRWFFPDFLVDDEPSLFD